MVHEIGIVLLVPSHVLVDCPADLDVVPGFGIDDPAVFATFGFGGIDAERLHIPVLVGIEVTANPHNVLPILHLKGHQAVVLTSLNPVGGDGGEVGGLVLVHCGVLSFGKFEF
jgi:hypothetical protein